MASGTIKLLAELNVESGRIDRVDALELTTPSEHAEAKRLLTGDNVFTRPATATEGVSVKLPPSNAVVTRVKWAAGDTAPPALKPAGGFMFQALDPANLPASIILNAAADHNATHETVVRWY